MPPILHIEDDPNSRRLVRKILAPAGHEVVDAESGLEGVRWAAEAHGGDVIVRSSPDPVLAERGFKGAQVVLRVRARPPLPMPACPAPGER